MSCVGKHLVNVCGRNPFPIGGFLEPLPFGINDEHDLSVMAGNNVGAQFKRRIAIVMSGQMAFRTQQKGMRSFAMDAIQQASVLNKATKAISKRELNSFVGQGYGIFSGATVRWAKLRFSAERTRWVSRELWHPLQRSTQDIDGKLVLELPFTDMRELSMDILRHGRHVEVLEPSELRLLVQVEMRQALEQYSTEIGRH